MVLTSWSSLYNYEIRFMLKEKVRFKKNHRGINLSSLYNFEITRMLKENVRSLRRVNVVLTSVVCIIMTLNLC